MVPDNEIYQGSFKAHKYKICGFSPKWTKASVQCIEVLEEPTQTCMETCIAQCSQFQKQLHMDMHSTYIVYLS